MTRSSAPVAKTSEKNARPGPGRAVRVGYSTIISRDNLRSYGNYALYTSYRERWGGDVNRYRGRNSSVKNKGHSTNSRTRDDVIYKVVTKFFVNNKSGDGRGVNGPLRVFANIKAFFDKVHTN